MGLTDKLRRSLNGQEEEDEDGIITSISNASTLSWSTRIKGFIICFVAGIILSILGSIFVFLANYIAFAVLYSVGTLTSLASTMFLMGPVNQLKKMFDPTRLIATIILLVCIVLTIIAAKPLEIPGLCIFFCILQFIALAWYSISYIPFARYSFIIFALCTILLIYLLNSVIIYNAPLLATIAQLLIFSMNGELDVSNRITYLT
ncbi:hypothetical protein EB796_008621 [Bugula neritina]|uniref:Vesicle transport protein n=1 Tax=Bugula neritina TaxID=10212 RepID=A0A7J7K334_BUGNE|nr:hypothetical protein EB796_008621 [Bugula neritina]